MTERIDEEDDEYADYIKDLRRETWAMQLQFWGPRGEVKSYIDKLGLKAETEIWVFPDYPTGYTAVFGSGDDLYIVCNNLGRVTINSERPMGFRPNGMPIV